MSELIGGFRKWSKLSHDARWAPLSSTFGSIDWRSNKWFNWVSCVCISEYAPPESLFVIIRSSRSFVIISCLITNRQGYTTCTVGPCQEWEQQTVRNRHRRFWEQLNRKIKGFFCILTNLVSKGEREPTLLGPSYHVHRFESLDPTADVFDKCSLLMYAWAGRYSLSMVIFRQYRKQLAMLWICRCLITRYGANLIKRFFQRNDQVLLY